MNARFLGANPYFASIKRLILPYILLNIAAVIIGLTTANIVNLMGLLPKTTQSGSTQIARLNQQTSLINQAQKQSSNLKIENQVDIPFPPLSADPFLQFLRPQPIKLTADPKPVVQLPKHTFAVDEVESSLNQQQERIDIDIVGVNPATGKELNRELARKVVEPEIHQLILPTLDVATHIINVPIANGNWDISKLDDNAGILDGFSTHPEDSGPLVIAAHATTEWPTAGPFAELRHMNLGDPILVQIGEVEYVYEISRFLQVDSSNVHVLNKGGEDGIVLVTCDSYNFFTGAYGTRFVAYGNLKETRPASSNIES